MEGVSGSGIFHSFQESNLEAFPEVLRLFALAERQMQIEFSSIGSREMPCKNFDQSVLYKVKNWITL